MLIRPRFRSPLLSVALALAAWPARGQGSGSPSPHLDWTLTPAAIESRCAEALKAAAARLDRVAALPQAERSFEGVVVELDLAQADLGDATASPTFLKYVSPDKAVRDAGHACEAAVERFGVELYTRPDLYAAVKDSAAKGGPSEGEDRRLLEKTLLEFKRNGLALDPLGRARYKLLKSRLVELELGFGKTLNEVKDYLAVSQEELLGLPEDYVKRLERLPDGRYKVTLDYPDYFPFMENARSAQARRRLDRLYKLRAFPENTAALEEALDLRRRLARLVGFPTHAHYVLAERMAKTPAQVRPFLERLRRKLQVKGRSELADLLALKSADEPGAKGLGAWDYLYYDNQLKKKRYAVDDEKVKEYFPLGTVTEGMLALYQGLLGLKFEEVSPAGAWHPDVKLFAVTDAGGADPLGHFYMDLFPREGKYKHAAAFTLVTARRGPAGERLQRPVSSIVANFNKPTAEAPSLLKHSEVETYFHEFGHIMHQLLTRARHPRFAGTRVARDFVEAPSQMMENWVWEPEVLRTLSRHHKSGDPLPEGLLKRMVEAKNLDSGLRYLRQVFYASYDQACHGAKAVDPNAEYQRLFAEVTLFPPSPDTHPEAGFGHLMGGYDASYYGYLWSEVFSADMFARFKKAGISDARLGREYRRQILEPGGGLDEASQLRAFLGREPREEAFLESIGLTAAAER